MDETNDWTRRVDQMTAATAHEQLRAVIGEAQEMLVRFNESASEQGGLLLDAQRELESSMDRKLAQVSKELAESIAAVRAEIDQARSSSEERFDSIMSRLEQTAGLEERASARMVDLLANAFAALRNGAGNAHVANGRHDPIAVPPQR